MTENEMMSALKALFPQAEVHQAGGSSFWFVAGDQKKRLPFLTLVKDDEHDTASNLSRPGVYRLNVGLTPERYRERFGPPPRPRADWGVLDTGYDYTALDTPMPHPIYGALNWACVLNPSLETFAGLRPLLLEAYARARQNNE